MKMNIIVLLLFQVMNEITLYKDFANVKANNFL